MRFITPPSLPSLLGSAVIAGALLLAPSSARATGSYPGTIAAKLGGPTPQCTICHQTNAGGSGTATQLFAANMKAKYSLTGGGNATALEAGLDTNKDDVDGDGTSDVDELKAGDDPNSGNAAVDPPSYGCIEQNGSIAGPRSQSPRLASMAVAGLLAGFLFFRRRRLGSLL